MRRRRARNLHGKAAAAEIFIPRAPERRATRCAAEGFTPTIDEASYGSFFFFLQAMSACFFFLYSRAARVCGFDFLGRGRDGDVECVGPLSE